MVIKLEQPNHKAAMVLNLNFVMSEMCSYTTLQSAAFNFVYFGLCRFIAWCSSMQHFIACSTNGILVTDFCMMSY